MSDKMNDGGAAFPSQWDDKDNEGMSLRDWFAGQALAGILSNPNIENKTFGADASAAFAAADAMLAAGGKP